MGNTNSSTELSDQLIACDESMFEYEPIDPDAYDGYVMLKWKCVPEPIKQKMISRVLQKIDAETLESESELLVDAYWETLRRRSHLKGHQGIRASYKWAVLEALNILGNKRKFVLQAHGLWWRVSFIYDADTSYHLGEMIRDSPSAGLEPATLGLKAPMLSQLS